MAKLKKIIHDLIKHNYYMFFSYHSVKNGLYIEKDLYKKFKLVLHKFLKYYIKNPILCFNSPVVHKIEKKIDSTRLNIYITDYLSSRINCYNNIIDIKDQVIYIFIQFLLMCIIEMSNNNRNILKQKDYQAVINHIKQKI